MLESCTNTNYRVVHPYKLESRARLCCAYTLIHTCVYVHADEEEFTRQTHKQFEKLCEIQGGVTVIDVHKLMEVCVLELTCARVMYCEYITCAQNSPATHCNTLPHCRRCKVKWPARRTVGQGSVSPLPNPLLSRWRARYVVTNLYCYELTLSRTHILTDSHCREVIFSRTHIVASLNSHGLILSRTHVENSLLRLAITKPIVESMESWVSAAHCITLQHTATHCNTLQHTATHCSKHIATYCNGMGV